MPGGAFGVLHDPPALGSCLAECQLVGKSRCAAESMKCSLSPPFGLLAFVVEPRNLSTTISRISFRDTVFHNVVEDMC